MPPVTITPVDLEPFADIDEAKAAAMIDDALAMATLIAPCIAEEDFAHAGAVKAILRGAILRWHESGSGAVSSQVAGPFQQTIDTSKPRRAMFWPSEIEQLQKVCTQAGDGGAWAYDTLGFAGVQHADACTLNLGGEYCSCGAVLAGYPLWEDV